jgi:hypothetical protein
MSSEFLRGIDIYHEREGFPSDVGVRTYCRSIQIFLELGIVSSLREGIPNFLAVTVPETRTVETLCYLLQHRAFTGFCSRNVTP